MRRGKRKKGLMSDTTLVLACTMDSHSIVFQPRDFSGYKTGAVHPPCCSDWSRVGFQTVTPPHKKSATNKFTVAQGGWRLASSGTKCMLLSEKTMATGSHNSNLLNQVAVCWLCYCSCHRVIRPPGWRLSVSCNPLSSQDVRAHQDNSSHEMTLGNFCTVKMVHTCHFPTGCVC